MRAQIDELSLELRQSFVAVSPTPPTFPIDGANSTGYSVSMHQTEITECLESKHPNPQYHGKQESQKYFLLNK